ncbi:MAG: DUF937 domain-containing protein [Bdellovibrionales bacterium]|nr:DUF937 domain-containing protein [Bdellovibrionales bacterium]
MSMMDSIQEKAASVFGSSNTQLTQAVSKIIDECGGMDGLIKKFQDKGLGDTVQSWIGNTPNKSVTADQITNVLGPALLQKVASKVGMAPETLSQQLATYLPLLVDKLSPEGMVPHEGWWAKSLDKAKEFFGMNKH